MDAWMERLMDKRVRVENQQAGLHESLTQKAHERVLNCVWDVCSLLAKTS